MRKTRLSTLTIAFGILLIATSCSNAQEIQEKSDFGVLEKYADFLARNEACKTRNIDHTAKIEQYLSHKVSLMKQLTQDDSTLPGEARNQLQLVISKTERKEYDQAKFESLKARSLKSLPQEIEEDCSLITKTIDDEMIVDEVMKKLMKPAKRPQASLAEEMTALRFLLVNRLQSAGQEVVIGHQPGNPFGEEKVIIVYRAPKSLVSAIVKKVPPGDYSPEWVAPRFFGNADVTRNGNIALIIVGAGIEDKGATVLKKEFLAINPDGIPNSLEKITPLKQESIQFSRNRYWFTRWVESAPDQIALGAFVLSFSSENLSEIENVANNLKKHGLTVMRSVLEFGGRKSYWAYAMLTNIWGPEHLSSRLEEISNSWERNGSVNFHGWSPAEVGQGGAPIFPSQPVGVGLKLTGVGPS